MSIIGYDCDGKPLKSGDAVVIVYIGYGEFAKATGLKEGDVVRVLKKAEDYDDSMVINVKPKGYGAATVASESVRKLPDDQHKASDQSFSDLMHGLGCDAGVTA